MCGVLQTITSFQKMARNHKFFFDNTGSPKARGPSAEKRLMNFLETDIQDSDSICRDLMDDLTAIEDGSDDSREFIGNAHQVVISPQGAAITELTENGEPPTADCLPYNVALKHFREVLEDWEAFILDDQMDDPRSDDAYL